MIPSSAATASGWREMPSASASSWSGTSACPTSRPRPIPPTGRDPAVIAGIDLGGTKIQGVVLDGTTVVADVKRPTPDTGGVAVAAAIAETIAEMGVDVDHVGIGAPGVIDRDRGAI